MRRMSTRLPNPFPMVGMMPAVFQEDPVTRELTAAFDDVLGAVFATLDCLTAYVDVHVAPPDFLEWLAGWVGVSLDEGWPADRRRAAVAGAVEQHRCRGTAHGLQSLLDLVTDGRARVADEAGTTWSATPGPDGPGPAHPTLVIRVDRTVTDDELAEVDALVARAKPAHIGHRVERDDG